jgi:hypothetical protein
MERLHLLPTSKSNHFCSLLGLVPKDNNGTLLIFEWNGKYCVDLSTSLGFAQPQSSSTYLRRHSIGFYNANTRGSSTTLSMISSPFSPRERLYTLCTVNFNQFAIYYLKDFIALLYYFLEGTSFPCRNVFTHRARSPSINLRSTISRISSHCYFNFPRGNVFFLAGTSFPRGNVFTDRARSTPVNLRSTISMISSRLSTRERLFPRRNVSTDRARSTSINCDPLSQ